ncbi:hypothetical protein PR202_gb15842 [Eleusine coracana subsp. coracana]|uniref:PLAT domain-containing protein n=1 Tax=Eleusine coracana subsp. coracana TaxID=191504 RepID=A0AAV5EYW2_ELECO|nr:hypothetical protein QOZ80_4BG0351080 [Eleusine coracana subsp. coracana]GJN27791.1 hypothetical protein PR202_gb15842 [Eleusine coracana subsp. coracana]
MKPTIIALTCLLALAYAATTASAVTCTFDIRVKTGEKLGAGTNSRVTLQVSDAGGQTLVIPDLTSWGQMGPGYDYFEFGHLDRFSGTGTCFFPNAPCQMLLYTDGKGFGPGWYVSYVQVTQLVQGSITSKMHTWTVEQWLAVDEPPYALWALRDDCVVPFSAAALHHRPSSSSAGVEAD